MRIHFSKILFFRLMCLGALFLLCRVGYGQESTKKNVIQFSGVVVTQDSTMGIPGVNVYVPKGGRGTSTNMYGYFSFAVLAGDSVVISAVGLRKKHLIIPSISKDNYTVIIPMVEDTTMLEEQVISPFPTEEMFKEAVLAMQLPNQQGLNSMDRNLSPAQLAMLAQNMPMDGSMNYRYFTQMHSQYLFDGSGPRYNPLLNPLAWMNFFKSLKKKKK